jgi:hypothetical protein
MNALFAYTDLAGTIIKDTAMLPKAAVQVELKNSAFFAVKAWDAPFMPPQYFELMSANTEYTRGIYAKYFNVSVKPEHSYKEIMEVLREVWDTATYRDGVYELAQKNEKALKHEKRKKEIEDAPAVTTTFTGTATTNIDRITARTILAGGATLHGEQVPAAPAEILEENNPPTPPRRRITIIN